MLLDYIIPRKTNQWLKTIIFLIIIAVLGLTIFYYLKFEQEKSGHYYIDPNYDGWLKWGSEKHPYADINAAFKVIDKRNMASSNIFLKKGEYAGGIELRENTKIYGADKNSVIIKGNVFSPALIMHDNSLISNVTITGGAPGISVENRAIIENCMIKDFQQMGIDAKLSDSEIIIKNSEMFNGNNKGVYIQKGRKIIIDSNKIYNNHGEGLDVRAYVSGVISNNEIYKNSESGIELIVGGSTLDISKNNIWGNESAGITAQYYQESPETGNIVIQANHISVTNPEKFSITVQSPSGGTGRPENYWRDSIKIFDDNIIEGEIKNRSLEITGNNTSD
jgi:hypothetical protein